MGKIDNDNKYELAEALTRAGRYSESISLYKELILMNPGEDSFRLSLAWAYRDSGNIDAAITIFEQLLEKELGRKVFTGFAFDELVRIFRERSDYSRMIRICELAAEAQPDDVSILFTLGEAYLSGERNNDAIRIFEKITGMEPDSSAFAGALGNALMAAGDYERAENAYARAAEIEPPGAGEYYNKLGDAYMKAGEYPRAQAAYRKAIHNRPGQPIYLCNLGDALIKEDRSAEAEAAYNEAVRNNPQYASAYYNRFGNALARDNRHGKAIEVFRKAIRSDPRNPFLYLHLAQSCIAEGLISEAEEAYAAATTLEAGS